jgi:hypothetical protein
MSYETDYVEVIAYDKKSGQATISDEKLGKLRIFCSSFFGGKFASYPKIGNRLNIRLETIERKVIEAWGAKSINV